MCGGSADSGTMHGAESPHSEQWGNPAWSRGLNRATHRRGEVDGSCATADYGGVPGPQGADPRTEPLAAAARRVVDAVSEARFDRSSDEPVAALTVSEALGTVEVAVSAWTSVADDVEAQLDAEARVAPPEGQAGARVRQGALMMLHIAVMNEVALVRPLELVAGDTLVVEVPDWPTEQAAHLYDAAFGAPGEPGLVELLTIGTDDDQGWLHGQQTVTDLDLYSTVSTIVERSAAAVTSVIAGVSAAPLVGMVPQGAGLPESVRQALERIAEWAIDDVVDHLAEIAGRVSRLVHLVLARVRRLLGKILGTHRDAVAAAAGSLVALAVEDPTRKRTLVVKAMISLYGTGDVLDRAHDALTGAGRGPHFGIHARLERLKTSNKRWVTPVRGLTLGLGWLWTVPLGPTGLPVAPVAAAALLAWTVLVSGDQLDSANHFPNFWKGVVQRAGGK